MNSIFVGAYADEKDPQMQWDLQRAIGATNLANGWDPRFAYVKHVTSDTGRVWVAASVRIAWETHRDYWIDHVRVSTDPVLEGDANLDGRVDSSEFVTLAAHFGTRFFCNWAWGDFNQDRWVNSSDFALLASNFGRGTSPGELTAADWSALHAFAAGTGVTVPEPGHAAWVLGALAAMLGRRCGMSRSPTQRSSVRR